MATRFVAAPVAVLAALVALVPACKETGFRGQRVEVIATDASFDPSTMNLESGTFEFVLRNQSETEHDFHLYAEDGTELTSIDVVQPGLSRGTAVDLRPGTYTYACKVEGHDQRGQRGTLVVR